MCEYKMHGAKECIQNFYSPWKRNMTDPGQWLASIIVTVNSSPVLGTLIIWLSPILRGLSRFGLIWNQILLFIFLCTYLNHRIIQVVTPIPLKLNTCKTVWPFWHVCTHMQTVILFEGLCKFITYSTTPKTNISDKSYWTSWYIYSMLCIFFADPS